MANPPFPGGTLINPDPVAAVHRLPGRGCPAFTEALLVFESLLLTFLRALQRFPGARKPATAVLSARRAKILRFLGKKCMTGFRIPWRS